MTDVVSTGFDGRGDLQDALDGSAIEAGLREWFDRARSRTAGFDAHYRALWERLERAAAGGKHQRPALVLAAHRGLGGTQDALAVQLGIAFELLHTAFIIHDDLIDRDDVRRGQPNVSGAFRRRAVEMGADPVGAATWAEAAGLLAGDLALSQAHRIIGGMPVGDDVRTGLLDILDEAVFVSAAGELSDVTNAFGPDRTVSPVTDVLTTLERKTAVYSFVAPLQAGGLLAGASVEHLEALGRYGRLTGVAFQLADDLLGIFGDEGTTGKSTIADLREGKYTTLIALAAQTDAWPRLAPFVGNPSITPAQAATARRLLDDCGARQRTVELAREHVALAQAELGASDLPVDLIEHLFAIADRAADRLR